ncbi:MAG: GHKL domain-containing protein [Ruminococcus sp.]|nr:GHKL domain-containing protein [Ruminococcus sp.]
MNIILTITSYLYNIPLLVQGFLLYQILSHFAGRRPGKFWTAIVYISCTVISSMIIFPNDLFNVTIVLIWFALLMVLAFQGSIWQKLAAVFVLYPLIISQNFLVMDILGHLGDSLGWPKPWDMFCTIADPILHLLIWYCIYKIFQKHLPQIGKLFDNKIWILLNIICLASLVSITTCIYFAPEQSIKMWPAAFACFATNLGCIALAEYFIISIQQDMERKNLILQKSYYEELEQNQAQIRKLRHDMNNHLSTIQALFRSGRQEEAEQYLQEIEGELAVRSRVFCKNSIINAILNAKYNLALEHHIDSFFHIDLDKLIGIDAISLCCLFSNTLDNAIEASVKIPDIKERHLSVKARVTENGYFTYEISNAKKNAILEQKGRFKSDKADGGPHGLGLSNVRETVEKYNGTLDISYTEDTFTVTVLIGNA